MLRDTRPCVGVDARIDVHCADRVCVGCCAHVSSSLAVFRASCSRSWRCSGQQTLRLLRFNARLTRRACCRRCWFREQGTECGEISRTVISSRRDSFQGLRSCRHPPALSNNCRRAKEFIMSKEQDNKAIVGRWFTEFWGNTWDPAIVDELCTADILLQYSLHAPRRGRADVKAFMTAFREAFPDLSFAGAADLIAEGDYVVGRWVGGGTHSGPAFSDFLQGSLPARSGRKMRFTGTTVL